MSSGSGGRCARTCSRRPRRGGTTGRPSTGRRSRCTATSATTPTRSPPSTVTSLLSPPATTVASGRRSWTGSTCCSPPARRTDPAPGPPAWPIDEEQTMWTTTVQPVLIALMVVLEVAVWQVRVALATRGRKRIAAALGAVNAVISVVALGQVVTNLDRPANVVGYAVGVAVGVYLGVVADGRFAGDPVEYRVVL